MRSSFLRSALVLLLSAGPLQAQSARCSAPAHPEVAAMLGDLGGADRGRRPPAGRLRHPPHALRRPTTRTARHRRGPVAGSKAASSDRIAAETGGRLVVAEDRFTQQEAGRGSPRPVEIVNVVATLPGTQPESADRVLRRRRPITTRSPSAFEDAEHDAPGANDDASGHRRGAGAGPGAWPTHEFDATVVFLARRRRGAGALRLDPLGRGWRRTRGMNIDGDVHQRHRRQHRAAATACTDDHPRSGVFSEGVPDRRDRAEAAPPALGRRRERRPVAPARPVHPTRRRPIPVRPSR